MRHRTPFLKAPNDFKALNVFKVLKVVKVIKDFMAASPPRNKQAHPFEVRLFVVGETIAYFASRHDFPTTTGGASGTKFFGTIGVENDMPADALRFTAS